MFLARGAGYGLLSGQSNKEIARTHGVSEVTIKHHLKSLRSKLGARNRTHAVCRAVELGIAEEAIPAMLLIRGISVTSKMQ